MAVILNPRGTAGSGKSEFVRRILTDYGWRMAEGRVEPIRRWGRERPIGYRLQHPLGGPPLAVLGHYAATRGGCDTIPATDGGLDEAFRLADELASTGHDVLLEGLLLSAEHRRSVTLAQEYALHILRLDTPPDRCVRNLVRRWYASGSLRPLIAGVVLAQRDAVEDACARLRWCAASVEVLGFDEALRRARRLLGLTGRIGL